MNVQVIKGIAQITTCRRVGEIHPFIPAVLTRDLLLLHPQIQVTFTTFVCGSRFFSKNNHAKKISKRTESQTGAKGAQLRVLKNFTHRFADPKGPERVRYEMVTFVLEEKKDQGRTPGQLLQPTSWSLVGYTLRKAYFLANCSNWMAPDVLALAFSPRFRTPAFILVKCPGKAKKPFQRGEFWNSPEFNAGNSINNRTSTIPCIT